MILLLAIVLGVLTARRQCRRRTPRSARMPNSRRAWSVIAVAGVLAVHLLATAPPAVAAACGEAPNPQRPGSGLVGALDPAAHGTSGSPYADYGYAGLVWNTYETDCGPLSGLTSPSLGFDTWAGGQLLDISKGIVGTTNSLQYMVADGSLLTPIYSAVKSGADKSFANIYTQLFALAALLLSLALVPRIWKGDFAAVSKRALYGLAGTWIAASSIAMLAYLGPIDHAIVATTTNIKNGFTEQENDPAARDALPTALHEHVIYDNWLRGEFGSPTAPQAGQFGRPLLDAQAFTWTQLRDGSDGNQQAVDAKKAAYRDISTKLGPATGYFTGEAGSRTGAGLLSLAEAASMSSFPLLANAAVLAAQVLIRLFILTAPLIGLVALLKPDLLRAVVKVAGTVGFHLVVISVLAGVHSVVIQALLAADTTLSVWVQILIAAMVTTVLIVMGRPLRRLWQMIHLPASLAAKAVGIPGQGRPALLFLRRRLRWPTAAPSLLETLQRYPNALAVALGSNPQDAIGRPEQQAHLLLVPRQRLAADGYAPTPWELSRFAGGRQPEYALASQNPRSPRTQLGAYGATPAGGRTAAIGGGGGGGSTPPPGDPPPPGSPDGSGDRRIIEGGGGFRYFAEAGDRVQHLPPRAPREKSHGFTTRYPNWDLVLSGEGGRDAVYYDRDPWEERQRYKAVLEWVNLQRLPDTVSKDDKEISAAHVEIKLLAMLSIKVSQMHPWERPDNVVIVVNNKPCHYCDKMLQEVSQTLPFSVTVYGTDEDKGHEPVERHYERDAEF
ncbi:hypothetical protein [Amycolatopsis saalfeldensis]|uniref:Uncharacterized protein n=1 Tax=Amycolatopsis saalfeldensis TaxID=394193 RepID=A0A1H8YNJ2_9PSEU|nr:hypothetical protein [Amycolatopsis saalfeldensis]SEP53719.1 hypothetical protein SAMN04489732_13021 [Amycolatopsis saalfeldensis]